MHLASPCPRQLVQAQARSSFYLRAPVATTYQQLFSYAEDVLLRMYSRIGMKA
jgi:hypothetical protein